MEHTIDKHCKGCKYLFKGHYGCTKCCDYLLITGEPRGCPAGEGCTKKEIGNRDKVTLKFAKKAGGENGLHST